MHGNREYWAKLTAPLVVTASGTSMTGLTAQTATACEAATCTPDVLAAKDMQTWVKDMSQQFPTYTAKVTCTAEPVSCVIYVDWIEKQVAITSTTQAQADAVSASITKPSFSVYVRP